MGVRYCAIVETGGEYAGQMMGIGLLPDRKEVAGRYVSHLPNSK